MEGNLIMVVDDNPQLLALLEDYLEMSHYDVIQAANADSALKLFKKHKPRIVLTDVVMPKHSGIQLITELREIDPEVHIVAMTGGCRVEGVEDYIEMCYTVGANAVITKPFDLSHLKELLDNF